MLDVTLPDDTAAAWHLPPAFAATLPALVVIGWMPDGAAVLFLCRATAPPPGILFRCTPAPRGQRGAAPAHCNRKGRQHGVPSGGRGEGPHFIAGMGLLGES